ncbi:Fe-S cluster assembly ATPase SufC [Candidatus Dojkabacteria bacterium]|uniref:Fe-S cluster assembly ATPase SufC n=1 Tax=Candidatus Dojkabacteria bacterium TaxID=2099670 RepID=A0A955RMA6_9BACT|nr:Fe-S cluster assembly ATPase SufC [Candidatus Dojkabacteria bacterium]
MLNINNLSVLNADSQIKILDDISLKAGTGEVIYIFGSNGSGKSTLLSTLMGDPQFEISAGNIVFENNDITESSPTDRSIAGMFLASQHPIELPGVSMKQYLRLIYNIHHKEKLPVFKFREVLKDTAEKINYPKELLDRNVNEGFSGGEKKKTEILQMLLLEPKIIMLDEIDSGLDTKSRKSIFEALKVFRTENKKTIWLIVSHYDEIKEYLKPTKEFEIVKGKLH